MTDNLSATRTISDTEILQMLIAGTMAVSTNGPVPVIMRKWSGAKRWERKQAVPDGNKVRRTVRLRSGQAGTGRYRYRTILAANLVWMAHHRSLIPDGFAVDHKDGNPANDHPDNLQLQPNTESDCQGFARQTHRAFLEVLNFFNFIATHGREPSPREESWHLDGF